VAADRSVTHPFAGMTRIRFGRSEGHLYLSGLTAAPGRTG
jgi:hypothetical protein